MFSEVYDLLLEFRDTAKGGVLDGAVAEQPETGLDVVQLRGSGRDEVQVEAWLLGNPQTSLHRFI